MKKKKLKLRHPEMIDKTIYIELDGVLTTSWDPNSEEMGDVNPKAMAWLKQIKNLGYYVIVYSYRTDRKHYTGRTVKDGHENMGMIKQWLRSKGLWPFVDALWEGDVPIGKIVSARAVNAGQGVGDIIEACEKPHIDEISRIDDKKSGWLGKLREVLPWNLMKCSE